MYVNTYIFQNIFESIILNVNNDPCFEEKSSSLTLRYRPVHFFENSCICMYVAIVQVNHDCICTIQKV